MHDSVKDAELALLKSQFRPHFVFNSLNSISSLTITKPKNARDMIAKLSEYLRYTMQHDEESLSSWKDELSSVESFLEIEQIRYGERLEFSINGDPKCLEAKIPTLLLQPVVENAIKYGVYESTEPVLIKLDGTCNSEILEITVTNPYDQDAMPEKGNGIGLLNLKKRMALLYSRRDLVSIRDDGKRFTVEIKIPQIYEQHN